MRWKRLDQIVDLGVLRSSRGGGTISAHGGLARPGLPGGRRQPHIPGTSQTDPKGTAMTRLAALLPVFAAARVAGALARDTAPAPADLRRLGIEPADLAAVGRP